MLVMLLWQHMLSSLACCLGMHCQKQRWQLKSSTAADVCAQASQIRCCSSCINESQHMTGLRVWQGTVGALDKGKGKAKGKGKGQAASVAASTSAAACRSAPWSPLAAAPLHGPVVLLGAILALEVGSAYKAGNHPERLDNGSCLEHGSPRMDSLAAVCLGKASQCSDPGNGLQKCRGAWRWCGAQDHGHLRRLWWAVRGHASSQGCRHQVREADRGSRSAPLLQPRPPLVGSRSMPRCQCGLHDCCCARCWA